MNTCGAWMPRARERCARNAGHRWRHWTAAYAERRREQQARRAADPHVSLRNAQRMREVRAAVTEARLRGRHPNVGTDNLRLKPLD